MKLLALRCPTCAQNLSPNSPEVVVLRCANCDTAVSINDTGLETIRLQFAIPALEPEKIDAWVPLWIFDGRVNITSRQTQGRNQQAQQDSEQLWSYPRRLYVPAWELSTEAACQIGGEMVQRQPVFQNGAPPPKTSLVEAVISPEDALKLLEFVVFNVEAARKDWLKDLRFTIEVNEPQLWAIPAQSAGGSWRLQPLVK
jgi:hypothetical protein